MPQTNDGGPAFPVITAEDPNGIYRVPIAQGMSLRDWFAGLALAGSVQKEKFSGAPTLSHAARGQVAGNCYAMADAMLKAREKP